MPRVWFPNMYMKLVSLNTARVPAEANLLVSPKMTKTEVREYLTKIYNIPVISVTTMNQSGKWKRLHGKNNVPFGSYRRREVKKATVKFHYTDAEAANNAA